MQAEEARRVRQRVGEPRDRQARGVGRDQRLRRRARDRRQRRGLDGAVLRHALDDEAAAREALRRDRRGADPRQDRRRFSVAEATARDLPPQGVLEPLSPGERRRRIAPAKGDVEACRRNRLRDAKPHQAGADDADAAREVSGGNGRRH